VENIDERGVYRTSFEVANVGAVQAGDLTETFLTQLQLLSQHSNSASELLHGRIFQETL
jgi:hypothetical protein